MWDRISNESQTTPTSSEQPSVTTSVKSTNSSESKTHPTTNKPNTKRKLQQAEGKNSDKKKAKLQSSEMRTTFEYDGIGPCDNETTTTENKNDKILSNCIFIVCRLLNCVYILVPCWRITSPTTSHSSKVKSEVKTEVSLP